jgi:hypothetical protein
MTATVDAHEVFDLAGVLAVAGDVAAEDAKAIVKKGANNIKNDWRESARGIDHAPRYPRSISYDVTARKNDVEAVIGPEDSPENQGFLGRILEFGGAHNTPRNDGGRALDVEEPKFEAAMADIAGRTI